jgi:hypothetical protein
VDHRARRGQKLVARHPRVARVLAVDPKDGPAVRARLGLCASRRRASRACSPSTTRRAVRPRPAPPAGHRREPCRGLPRRRRPAALRRTGPWFDMGLLSVHGKAGRSAQDRERGEPSRALRAHARHRGEPGCRSRAGARPRGFARRTARRAGAVIGLNTGPEGWESAPAGRARRQSSSRTRTGGRHPPPPRGRRREERNAAIRAGLARRPPGRRRNGEPAPRFGPGRPRHRPRHERQPGPARGHRPAVRWLFRPDLGGGDRALWPGREGGQHGPDTAAIGPTPTTAA